MQVCLPLPRLRQVPPHLLSISPCLQSWVAHVGCCELLLPACLPACLPAFLPSFLPSCLPAFLPSFLPSFLRSRLPSFLPSFLPSTRKREKNPKKEREKNPKKNNPPLIYPGFTICSQMAKDSMAVSNPLRVFKPCNITDVSLLKMPESTSPELLKVTQHRVMHLDLL